MSEQLYCAHVRPDGTHCRGFASKATGYCYWHDPAAEEQRATGLHAPRPQPDPNPVLQEEVPLETVSEIQAVLCRLANDLPGAPHPDTARAQSLAAGRPLGDLERQVETSRKSSRKSASPPRALAACSRTAARSATRPAAPSLSSTPASTPTAGRWEPPASTRPARAAEGLQEESRQNSRSSAALRQRTVPECRSRAARLHGVQVLSRAP